jgi:NAD(P)-dependent dehydrogenase (short-subunit alcohol dehydrogenase family)
MNTILITGSNRGLGLEFTRQYAEDDWRVLACCRRESEELRLLRQRFVNVEVRHLDVTDHAAIEALSDALAAQPIDVLLNVAASFGRVDFPEGGMQDQRFGNTDYQDWARMFRINVMGPMKMAESFVNQVAASRQKKIVTLTSMVGSMALNTVGGIYRYRSTKAAVNAIMHSMAIDLRPRGILAVAIHPGWARIGMGGPQADIDAATAVGGVRKVIETLNEASLGTVIAYSGEPLPY